MRLPEHLLNNRKLESLVENQTGFTLDIPTLSKEACMSASHFQRVFKCKPYFTPGDYQRLLQRSMF